MHIPVKTQKLTQVVYTSNSLNLIRKFGKIPYPVLVDRIRQKRVQNERQRGEMCMAVNYAEYRLVGKSSSSNRHLELCCEEHRARLVSGMKSLKCCYERVI